MKINFINIDAHYNLKDIIRLHRLGRSSAEECIERLEVAIEDWYKKLDAEYTKTVTGMTAK